MAEKRSRRQRRPVTGMDWEAQILAQDLMQTQLRLQQAYAAFDQVSDPDLVEAWSYEISAQQARYNYLLRQSKTLQQPERPEGGEARA